MTRIKNTPKKLNPKLGWGGKIILWISIMILIAGFQAGIPGFIIGTFASAVFYYYGIRGWAKHKKVDSLMIPLTKEELQKKQQSQKWSKKFWKVFLIGCVLFIILSFLFIHFILS